jgi:hypothetical protein
MPSRAFARIDCSLRHQKLSGSSTEPTPRTAMTNTTTGHAIVTTLIKSLPHPCSTKGRGSRMNAPQSKIYLSLWWGRLILGRPLGVGALPSSGRLAPAGRPRTVFD